MIDKSINIFHIAWRQLSYSIFRSFYTVIAIGAVISLMLVLDGFQQGLYKQLEMTALNRGADLILAQSGVSNMVASRSIIPQLTRLDVEAVDGVLNAHPLTAISAIYRKNDRQNPVYIFVYENKGGPLSLIAGSDIDEPREIIIDRTLAKLYDLSPGDSFNLTDFEFKIAGVAKNSAAFFTPFAFIKFDDLIDFYLESDIAADITTFPLLSYLLVELEDDADPLLVAKAIENAVPEVDVYFPEKIAGNDVLLGRELFGPILGLLQSIGFVIGLLVLGIVMFTNVHARKRSLAVIRALGFSVNQVAATVSVETAILVSVAFPVGVVLAQVIATVIPWISPLYLVLPTEPLTLIRTFIACIMLSFLGALIAIYIISKIEIDVAFRS